MKKRVLIVEDQLYTGLEISEMLKDLNFDPIIYIDEDGDSSPCITTGQDALDHIKNLSPDLILMDIKLSEDEKDLDGIDTAKVIMDKFNIPVVFLTAYGDKATIERAKKAQPYGYITKPITSKSEILATIEIALYNHEINKNLKEQGGQVERIKQIIDGNTTVIHDHFSNDTHVKKKFPEYENYFNALSSFDRLKIIKFVLNKPRKFGDIQELTDKPKSSLSHHIGILERNGLIQGLREGRTTIYSFNGGSILSKILISLDETGLEKIEILFNALASKERLLIMDLLKNKSESSEEEKSSEGITTGEIESVLKKSLSTITHHLKILQKADLIISERKGRNSIYHMKIDIFSKISGLFN